MKTNKLIVASIVIASTLLTGCASNSAPKTELYHLDARVNSIEQAPDVCAVEAQRGRRNVSRSIGGAILGGIVGNQFGSGNGRKITTVLGAALGSNAGRGNAPRGGNKLTCRRNGYIASLSYIMPYTQVMKTEKVRMQRKTRAKMINVPVCVRGHDVNVCL